MGSHSSRVRSFFVGDGKFRQGTEVAVTPVTAVSTMESHTLTQPQRRTYLGVHFPPVLTSVHRAWPPWAGLCTGPSRPAPSGSKPPQIPSRPCGARRPPSQPPSGLVPHLQGYR